MGIDQVELEQQKEAGVERPRIMPLTQKIKDKRKIEREQNKFNSFFNPVEEWRQRKIIEHEGFRLNPYKDTRGYVTGGVGHKLTKEDFLNFRYDWSDDQKREYWAKRFKEDYTRASVAAIRIANKKKVPPTERNLFVLTDMIFNMGEKGVEEGWPGFFEDLAAGKIEEAILNMKRVDKTKPEPSDWYTQVPERVEALAEILRGTA